MIEPQQCTGGRVGGAASSACSDLRELNEAKVANILSYLDEAVATRLTHSEEQPHESFYSEGLSATPPQYAAAQPLSNHLVGNNNNNNSNVSGNVGNPNTRPPPAPRMQPSSASVTSGLTSFVIGGTSEPHISVYHGIKAKIESLNFANNELRTENEELKSRLAAARQRESEHVEQVQKSARAELEALRQEKAESAKRSARTVQELQREKEQLTAAVDSLTSQLRQEMSRRETEVARLESGNAAAIAQLRTRWQAQEKAAREKWKLAEAKRIKESTLQSLEPDIVLLLNRHKAERARMREEFENELRQRDEALAAKDATVEETRAKLARDAAEVMSRAEAECRDRLSDETSRVNRQLEEERRRGRQQRDDMEASFAEQKATLQREVARLQRDLFALQESSTTDRATFHDAVAREVARITGNSNEIVADLKERLVREFGCREKEAQAHNAQYLAAKEEEIRRRCEAERDAAIADTAQKAEAERVRAATQSRGGDDVLREHCEQMSRAGDRLRAEVALLREQLRAAVEAVERREAEAVQLREAAALTEQRVRAIEERVRSEGEARLHVLDTEWQRRLRQFEIRHVEEVGALQHQLEKTSIEIDAAKNAAALELKSIEQKHSAELTSINERVLVALTTKENTVRAQAEQISLLQEAVRQRDEHIARHRELL